MNLSENFTYNELTASCTARRRGYNNTPSADVLKNLKVLCNEILQPIRNEWGEPIIIGSGYRCTKLNRAVGGVKNSDHVFGCAADIHTLSDHPVDNRVLFELIIGMYRAGKLPMMKQLIDEYGYNWLHISFQDGRTTKRGQIIHLP